LAAWKPGQVRDSGAQGRFLVVIHLRPVRIETARGRFFSKLDFPNYAGLVALELAGSRKDLDRFSLHSQTTKSGLEAHLDASDQPIGGPSNSIGVEFEQWSPGVCSAAFTVEWPSCVLSPSPASEFFIRGSRGSEFEPGTSPDEYCEGVYKNVNYHT